MRRLGIALLFASSWAIPATALDGAIGFRGNLCIVASNAACSPLGYSDGQCMTARLSLPYSDSDQITRLSIFWPYKSKSFTSAGQSLIGDDLQNVETVFVDEKTWTDSASMKFVAQEPEKLSETSTQVQVVGDITGFERSCFVRFRFMGQADPTLLREAPAVDDEEAIGESLSNNGSSYLKTLEPASN